MTERIDEIDRGILQCLQDNARRPYLDIARELGIAGGTVHQRLGLLKDRGVLKGFTAQLDYKACELGVAAFVGVHLVKAKDWKKVLDTVSKVPGVVEAHYTTGAFGLMVKFLGEDVDALHQFLANQIQNIDGVQSTETFLCLKTEIERPYPAERLP